MFAHDDRGESKHYVVTRGKRPDESRLGLGWISSTGEQRLSLSRSEDEMKRKKGDLMMMLNIGALATEGSADRVMKIIEHREKEGEMR